MTRIQVLDQGYVELLDVMGSDQAIVDAARLSVSGKGVKLTSSDEALIRYLYRHQHMTPFEMCEVKWAAKMPIFVARQMVRHRSFSINELSARYSELPDEYWQPQPEDLRKQSTTNKQGGEEPMGPEAVELSNRMNGVCSLAFEQYHSCLDAHMTREQARAVLPVATYTEWVWKSNLRNLLHFLNLRLDKHAQREIRVYAEAMADVIADKFPITWKAFKDFELGAIRLSRPELNALQELFRGGAVKMAQVPSFPTDREKTEFIAKLDKLGIVVVTEE